MKISRRPGDNLRIYIYLESSETVICQIADKRCRRFYFKDPNWAFIKGERLPRLYTDNVQKDHFLFDRCLVSSISSIGQADQSSDVVSSLSELPSVAIPPRMLETLHCPIDQREVYNPGRLLPKIDFTESIGRTFQIEVLVNPTNGRRCNHYIQINGIWENHFVVDSYCKWRGENPCIKVWIPTQIGLIMLGEKMLPKIPQSHPDITDPNLPGIGQVKLIRDISKFLDEYDLPTVFFKN